MENPSKDGLFGGYRFFSHGKLHMLELALLVSDMWRYWKLLQPVGLCHS